jgi:2-polyprenyl-6-methoxyphenol hydroxylase-like FAD-dependent oxidoreductase
MNAKVSTDTKVVTRQADAAPRRVEADICVVGAGIAGTSAALTAARAGRRVVLLDGLPVLGGQAVNSIIGTFCGLFANGTHGHQFTHGIADEILRDLGAKEHALYYRHGPLTTVVYYDEVALARWIEEAIRQAGITVVLGAVLRRVGVEGRRVRRLELATRYGDVHVEATGFVDASGDAALVWQAGFACREPANGPVFGTQMVILENIDESKQPTREEIGARMKEKGDEYGLVRREGLAFIIPGRGVAAMNMTHVETPLDPLEASARTLDGRDQADRAVAFLRREFPGCFGKSRVRAYGFPGIRQTRWIVGRNGRRCARRHAFPRRDRAYRLADRIARSWYRAPLAHLSRRPRSLRAAREPHSRRCRQRRRRRAVHRCRQCGAVERAGNGSVHRHGRRGGACARHRRHRQCSSD